VLEFFPFQDKRLLSLFSIQSAVTKRQLMIAILAFILQLGVAELAELNGIVACFTSGLAFSHGLKKARAESLHLQVSDGPIIQEKSFSLSR
jgi:hypothetical protein